MCSAGSDLNRKAVIRNAALELIADNGAEAVTVRAIADAAGVSAPLVIHHFGNKKGLIAAVNDYAARLFDSVLDQLAEAQRSESRAHASAGLETEALSAAIVRSFPPGSPLPRYLRRLLLEGDPTAARLFARWLETSKAFLTTLTAAHVARPSNDPDVRAAFLLVNDLAMIVFRDLIADAVGVDPLGQGGAIRWAAEVIDVYTHGAFSINPSTVDASTIGAPASGHEASQ